MTTPDGFQPITVVTADERARVAVDKTGAHARDRYAVSTNADGAIRRRGRQRTCAGLGQS